MSFAEIKEKVAALTSDEQEELRRFIVVQRLQHDPEWLAEMSRRIDSGKYVPQEEVIALHEKLKAEGR